MRVSQVESPSYRNPFFSGLLHDGHYKRMGMAIWTFFWLIDKTTCEYVDEMGIWWGKVLGGKPITAEGIAKDLGIFWRTIQFHLVRLKKEEYIRTTRAQHGLIIEVRNSKKFRMIKSYQSEIQNDKDLSISQTPTDKALSPDAPANKEQVQVNEIDKGLSPDEQNLINLNPANIDPPKDSPRDTIETYKRKGGKKKSPPPKIPKVKTKQGDPKISDTVLLENYFKEVHVRRYGREYVVKFGKDRKSLKELLGVHSLEILKLAIDLFFENEDPFFKKAGYTIGIFSMNINKLIQGIARKGQSRFKEI